MFFGKQRIVDLPRKFGGLAGRCARVLTFVKLVGLCELSGVSIADNLPPAAFVCFLYVSFYVVVQRPTTSKV